MGIISDSAQSHSSSSAPSIFSSSFATRSVLYLCRSNMSKFVPFMQNQHRDILLVRCIKDSFLPFETAVYSQTLRETSQSLLMESPFYSTRLV